MSEPIICDYCGENFLTKRIRKHPYLNLCKRCKDSVLGKKCLYCNDLINSQNKEEPFNYYCGYCESVKLGDPDRKWLPSLDKEDIDTKGFHKI